MEQSHSEILRDTAKSLFTNGLIDETTWQEFDVLFSSSSQLRYKPIEVEEFSAQEIKNLRNREFLSQADFALYLNTTITTIDRWERGLKKPTGTELILLNLVKQKGIRGLTSN